MALSQRDILATLDSIECDIHTQYLRIQRLRSTLKEQWPHITNAQGYWPEEIETPVRRRNLHADTPK